MKKYIPLALALLLAPAFAQDAEKPERGEGRRGPGGPRMSEEQRAEMLKKYDKDGDGQLSEEETKAMREEFRKEREARHAEMLKKYDKDGDGKLNEEEREAMMADMPARGEGRRGPGGPRMSEEQRAEMLKKYDKDGDGELNDEERKAMREEFRKGREARRASRSE